MAGWFDEESMVADGMGAGRARAVMARRRAIAGIGRPSASALEVEGALESFSTLAEGSPSYVYDDDDEEEDEDEDDGPPLRLQPARGRERRWSRRRLL